jgi:hypothetical protein
VTATQTGTGFSRPAVTDTDGLYVIPSLQPATYNLAVEAKGFSVSKQSGIALLADQTTTINVVLSLGSTTEVVTVTSNTLQVDTSTSTLSQVIEQQRHFRAAVERAQCRAAHAASGGSGECTQWRRRPGRHKNVSKRGDVFGQRLTAKFHQLPA